MILDLKCSSYCLKTSPLFYIDKVLEKKKSKEKICNVYLFDSYYKYAYTGPDI